MKCPICGTVFTKSNPNQFYCCKTCADTATYQSRKKPKLSKPTRECRRCSAPTHNYFLCTNCHSSVSRTFDPMAQGVWGLEQHDHIQELRDKLDRDGSHRAAQWTAANAIMFRRQR